MSPQTTTPPPPETVETRCAVCREETEHEVVKGKVVRGGLGVEGTFKCLECDRVHTGLVSFPAPLDIPFIVSSGEEAEPHAVQIFEDDQVAVGDEFEIDDILVEVTAVELKDQDRRVRRAQAQDIKTLWGKNINTIRVGFALNSGARTMSFEADFGPEDEVAVGDEFEYDEGDVVVERIVTDGGKRFSGSYNVREIKRVWLVRKGAPRKERRRDSDVPRGQKEQRAASRDNPRRSGGPRPHGRPKRQGSPGPSRGGPRREGGGSREGPWASGGDRDEPRTGRPRSNSPRTGGSGGSRDGPRSDRPRSGGPGRGGPRGGGPRSGGPGRGGPRSGGSGGRGAPGPSRGGPRGKGKGDRSRGRGST